MSASLPTQQQLLIPLLNTIERLDGSAPPSVVYDQLADQLGITEEQRRIGISPGSRYRAWDRTVRWTRQKSVELGYIGNRRFGEWMLTKRGRHALHEIKPGAVITVFESANGVALWAEASAAVRLIEDSAVTLILTSPPYPLLRKKAYQNQHPERQHVDWLLEQVRSWLRPLAGNGSLILNLGDAWMPGSPSMSLYQERLLLRLCDELGLHLCERLYWHSPKIPGPAEWVNVRRIRVTPAVEQLYWLAKTDQPKANNRRVLREYSASMRQCLARGIQASGYRPSGHFLGPRAFAADNGGSIPNNLISIPNTASRGAYHDFVRKQNLPAHPARFPSGLAEWLIRLLTDEQDLVWDPFGGSLTTAAACEKLNRTWVSNDSILEYLMGGIGRFGLSNIQMPNAGILPVSLSS